MKIRELLIDDLRRAHKYLSVQITVVVGLVATAADYIPTVHDYLPEGWSKYAIAAILAARVWKQAGLNRESDK